MKINLKLYNRILTRIIKFQNCLSSTKRSYLLSMLSFKMKNQILNLVKYLNETMRNSMPAENTIEANLN